MSHLGIKKCLTGPLLLCTSLFCTKFRESSVSVSGADIQSKLEFIVIICGLSKLNFPFLLFQEDVKNCI